jgi:hypothetical protein
MLSHVVMSVIQVFPSFVMLSLVCVFVRDSLPSIEMWFDRGEDWYYGLSKVGMVEMVGFRQVMWLVVLESAKDQILGVDILEQQVPPRVQYETTCLLIRYVVGCVVLGWVGMAPFFMIILCDILCDILCELPEPHGAKWAVLCGKPEQCKRGPFVGKP